MNTSLSPWASKLLAVTILIVVLFGIWALAVAPLQVRFAEYDATIEQTGNLLVRYERLARSHDQVVRELTDLEADLSTEEDFLTGQTEELAAVQVQQIVKRMAETAGATLQSVSIQEPETVDGFRKVSLQVKVASGIEGLQGLLHGLETSAPYLFVEDLSVRGGRGRVSGGAQGALLQVGFDVHGYLRRPAP